MLIGLVLVAVLVGVIVVLVGWARWLPRRTAAPARVARVAYVLLALCGSFLVLVPIATTAFTVFRFNTVAMASVEPAQKARVLAEGISEAMNMTALGVPLTLLLTILWLLYATWRFHWSARESAAPREPPYR